MTNTFDAHALADLLRLSQSEFLTLMCQGQFPWPTISPKGRFYWPESTIPAWLVLVGKYRAEKKQKPAVGAGRMVS
ncbi:MAG: hypothetical protein ACLP5H_34180 [Desulfomonilaceae bacterium]